MTNNDDLDALLQDPEPVKMVDCETCKKRVTQQHWDNCLERKVKEKLDSFNPFKKKTSYKVLMQRIAYIEDISLPDEIISIDDPKYNEKAFNILKTMYGQVITLTFDNGETSFTGKLLRPSELRGYVDRDGGAFNVVCQNGICIETDPVNKIAVYAATAEVDDGEILTIDPIRGIFSFTDKYDDDQYGEEDDKIKS